MMKFAILSLTILAAFGVEADAAMLNQTGENPKFWEGKAVVVAKSLTREFRGHAFFAEFEVLGVSYADVYVPSTFVVSNATRVNPAVTFQPQIGSTCVMCIERDGDFWRLPGWRTPLFGTGYFAKILGEDSEGELERMLEEIHDIRHGLKKSFLTLMREAEEAEDEP